MLTRRGLVFAVGAMAGGAAAGRAYAESGSKVVIASPPNPHVFPLLLAMQLDPCLGVTLRPVVESKDADGLLQTGEAQGVLAMSYVGAKKRVSGTVPDLRLVAPCYWRGFFHPLSCRRTGRGSRCRPRLQTTLHADAGRCRCNSEEGGLGDHAAEPRQQWPHDTTGNDRGRPRNRSSSRVRE